ncbi:MAG: ATP-dependent DNA helicase RecG [Coprobacillus sp.]|nr:ATP-dependent DNA helicase RecG [Coprobacillus sp.]
MKLTTSKRLNRLLYEMDIHSYYDVLFHIPKKYEIVSVSDDSKQYEDKEKIVVTGHLEDKPAPLPSYKTKMTTFTVISEKGREYRFLAYNQGYLEKTLDTNITYTFTGQYSSKNDYFILNKVNKSAPSEDEIVPIYSLCGDMKQFEYTRLVAKAFKQLDGKIYSQVPYSLIHKYNLPTKDIALNNVHYPKNKEDIRNGLLYLKYEEALCFAMKNKLIRQENNALSKLSVNFIEMSEVDKFINTLPYSLTLDQTQAVNEIINDMNGSSLMYRLLQGDVGSGKTIVAFICLYANFLRGEQGVFLAPTETLAKQHYENMKEIFKDTKVNIKLLTGSTSLEEKRLILEDLKDGIIDILVGTHAVFSKSTVYSHLGLVVVDEQHRFGVNQRSSLIDKGKEVDLLMMSATPIPRTLSQTMLSDLSVSTLYSFPNKKRDVKTKIIKNDAALKDKISETLSNSGKVYIIAPVIDSEQEKETNYSLFARYNELFPNKVCQLNGRMGSEEKEENVNKFKSGDKPILVSTQVVEVGIDVGDASMIVIYGGRRFGLSSLHQLRGRVGRNGQESTCYLVTDLSYSQEEIDRLKILTEVDDGFTLAEYDLKSRGPGELSGLNQSGIPDFKYLNVINDVKIFQSANRDADVILKNQNDDKGFKAFIDHMEKEINYDGDVFKG